MTSLWRHICKRV